MEQPGFFMSTA